MHIKIKSYISDNYEELLQLLRTVAAIPAPSGKEGERARFCCNWLKENGAENAYVDDVQNVVFEYNCENSSAITVISAHTDTVFPDTEPIDAAEDEKNIYCPGVGDDTAGVCILMMAIRFVIQNGVMPHKGILFVLNSCEEGLGNLKGTKYIFERYGKNVAAFIAFDALMGTIYDRCVGSHRYEVEVRTEGGHSFREFGKKNAISELSGIVSKIYEIQVPSTENSRTSYNVGIIEGGTSVNTIAQSAKMLCEYRSDDVRCLEIMKRRFEDIFSAAKKDGVEIQVKTIGLRECEKDVDAKKKQALADMCRTIVEDVTKEPVILKSASTDCNVPLSLGIPAVCVGVFKGKGAHTREEWVEKESLRKGLEIALRIAVNLN